MPELEVIHPGMQCLIQDIGRYGAAEQGLSQGGAVDLHAHCWANYLVGNDPNSPTIEITLGQAQFRATDDCLVVLTGADMHPTLAGTPVPNWHSFVMNKGECLKLGIARHGLRAYLAVRGGFDVPSVLGSCSAVLRNKIGGLVPGLPLTHNDRIIINHHEVIPLDELEGRQAAARFVPDYSLPITLRVIESYQKAMFQSVEKKRFYTSNYTVSQDVDRMGYRLVGPAVSADVDGIISEGIALGAIQFPPNGQPIVLLNDRQTLGGYPKLGCVARVDLPRLAQARPGDVVEFRCGDLAVLTEEWQRFSRFFGLSI
ncbi:biotin-dependent carboxyltransferase family protein [Photobacterium nomapromontoriensis]|uniref:5-oxoprolinase subunit C family protein n=1 Tax=Photobacterium nomapromontoriensis TaxID=2910237 RepID=UPI003D10DE9C